MGTVVTNATSQRDAIIAIYRTNVANIPIGSKGVTTRIAPADKLSDNQIPHAICRFTFEYFENVFIAPGWWESLDSIAQNVIIDRQITGGWSTGDERETSALKDDGLRLVNWRVVSRKTNVSF